MPDFERDRKRLIVWRWRSGWKFDAIVEYFGMGPDDVARIIFRAMNPVGFLHPYGRTMADVMKKKRKGLTVRRRNLGVDMTQAQIKDILAGEITTSVMRKRLERSLSAALPAEEGEASASSFASL